MDQYYDILRINEKYRGYILNSLNKEYNFCEGAYRSSKSTFNILAFALYLEKTPDQIHLAFATTESLAKSIIEDGNGLGLRYYFGSRYRSGKYKDCPAGFIKTANGEKIIIYLGGAKATDYQRFRGLSIGGIIMTEVNLLHPNTLTEAQGRILLAHTPRMFMDMNPDNPNHPIYKWLDGLIRHGKVNYIRTSIFDNPALTPDRRDEIISQFDPTSVFYKRYILGERVVAENLIYRISEDNIIHSYDEKDYSGYICVADPGITQSATAFVLAAYNPKIHSMDILKSYHHRNADEENAHNQKTSAQYADDFAQFVKDCHAAMGGRWPIVAIVDSFMGSDFYYYCVSAFRAQEIPVQIKFPIDCEGKQRKEDMSTRISMGVSLLYRKRLRFMDTCQDVISDFRDAQYDAKKLLEGVETRSDEFTAAGHGDALDSTEYAFIYYRSALV